MSHLSPSAVGTDHENNKVGTTNRRPARSQAETRELPVRSTVAGGGGCSPLTPQTSPEAIELLKPGDTPEALVQLRERFRGRSDEELVELFSVTNPAGSDIEFAELSDVVFLEPPFADGQEVILGTCRRQADGPVAIRLKPRDPAGIGCEMPS